MKLKFEFKKCSASIEKNGLIESVRFFENRIVFLWVSIFKNSEKFSVQNKYLCVIDSMRFLKIVVIFCVLTSFVV